jgi:Undecaprenyl-phosphate glucose phosphotransferase
VRPFFVAPELFVEFTWLAELIIIVACGYLSYIVRFLIIGGEPALRTLMPPPHYFWLCLVEAFVATHLLNFVGFYDKSALAQRLISFRGLLAALSASFGLLVIALFVTKASGIFSRGWILAWFCLSAFCLYLMRTAIKALHSRRGAARGPLTRRTVVFGAGELGQHLVERLSHQIDPTIALVGWFDDRDDERVVNEFHGQRVTGNFRDLLAFVQEGGVEQVILALPGSAKDRVLALVGRLSMLPVQVALAPDLALLHFDRCRVEHFSGLSVMVLTQMPVSHWSAVAKRTEDIILATIGIVLTAPVMAAIALAIRFETAGPALFRQERFGFCNKTFTVYKFRTMFADQCDPNGAQLVTIRDPRVTPFGRFLRKMSLDELPQLFNVLNGEMSIVGPRPHAMCAGISGLPYGDIIMNYAARHRVRPGITGWAQVNGWRGETDTEEKIQKRVEFDLEYIDKWSVWLDLRIIFQTLYVVLSSKNAY